jgi:hypothetical protein
MIHASLAVVVESINSVGLGSYAFLRHFLQGQMIRAYIAFYKIYECR